MSRSKIEVAKFNNYQQSGFVDEETEITMESLRNWVKSKGFHSEFFDTKSATDKPEYLNPDHPNFSLSLSIAVQAWMEFKDADTSGKSAKSAIETWLSGKYPNNELTKTAIQEIAKLVNWQTKGGAPKTPK